jgi:hypothetical protein
MRFTIRAVLSGTFAEEEKLTAIPAKPARRDSNQADLRAKGIPRRLPETTLSIVNDERRLSTPTGFIAILTEVRNFDKGTFLQMRQTG